MTIGAVRGLPGLPKHVAARSDRTADPEPRRAALSICAAVSAGSPALPSARASAAMEEAELARAGACWKVVPDGDTQGS